MIVFRQYLSNPLLWSTLMALYKTIIRCAHFYTFDTLVMLFDDLAAVKMKICRLCVITAEDGSGGGLSDGGAAFWGRRRPIGVRARKKVLLYMG